MLTHRTQAIDLDLYVVPGISKPIVWLKPTQVYCSIVQRIAFYLTNDPPIVYFSYCVNPRLGRLAAQSMAYSQSPEVMPVTF